MGRIGASLALGIILGPAIGGFLAQGSFVLPFFMAAIVAFLNFALMFFLLPESLKEKRYYKITIQLTWLSLPRIWQGLRGALMPLFLLSFVWSFALSNNQVNVPLLGIEKFALDTGTIGIGFAIMGLLSAITQFFFLSRITAIFGQHKTVTIGLILMGLSFAALPFVPQHIAFFYFVLAAAGFGSAVSRPVITALITEETTEPQGITLGTANAFESLGRLLGPLMGGVLFAFGMTVPFLFSGIVVILIVFFVIKNTHFLKRDHTY